MAQLRYRKNFLPRYSLQGFFPYNHHPIADTFPRPCHAISDDMRVGDIVFRMFQELETNWLVLEKVALSLHMVDSFWKGLLSRPQSMVFGD